MEMGDDARAGAADRAPIKRKVGSKTMGKKIRCPSPKCGSFNFEAVASSKKSLSLGKGIVGGVLLGPIGAVGGAMLGKKGKTTFVCHDCGNTWQVKL